MAPRQAMRAPFATLNDWLPALAPNGSLRFGRLGTFETLGRAPTNLRPHDEGGAGVSAGRTVSPARARIQRAAGGLAVPLVAPRLGNIAAFVCTGMLACHAGR